MTLWIFLDNIIVWAPSILHFKGLGMRNLQYEMRICHKSHNKVTKTVYVWFEFLWIRRYFGLWALSVPSSPSSPPPFFLPHYTDAVGCAAVCLAAGSMLHLPRRLEGNNKWHQNTIVFLFLFFNLFENKQRRIRIRI